MKQRMKIDAFFSSNDFSLLKFVVTMGSLFSCETIRM